MAKPSVSEPVQSTPQFVSRQIPLYYQLQTILHEKITSGSWAPGHRLPSEAELGDAYGVSRITVRQALAALESEGMLRREPGRGTFVTAPPRPAEPPRVEGSIEDFASFLKSTTVKVVTVARVQACAEEAHKLQLPIGAPLIRSTCLRTYRDEAYGVVVYDLPYEIGRRFSKSDWKEPVADVLLGKMGIEVTETRQSVRASLACVNAARMLSIRIGAPLLTIERLMSGTDGLPVVCSVTHCRSDVFSLVTNVRRESDDGLNATRSGKAQRNASNGMVGKRTPPK
jgi:GntR family transcriptional regulator